MVYTYMNCTGKCNRIFLYQTYSYITWGTEVCLYGYTRFYIISSSKCVVTQSHGNIAKQAVDDGMMMA